MSNFSNAQFWGLFIAIEAPIIVVLISSVFSTIRVFRVDQKLDDHLKFCDEFRGKHERS